MRQILLYFFIHTHPIIKPRPPHIHANTSLFVWRRFLSLDSLVVFLTMWFGGWPGVSPDCKKNPSVCKVSVSPCMVPALSPPHFKKNVHNCQICWRGKAEVERSIFKLNTERRSRYKTRAKRNEEQRARIQRWPDTFAKVSFPFLLSVLLNLFASSHLFQEFNYLLKGISAVNCVFMIFNFQITDQWSRLFQNSEISR